MSSLVIGNVYDLRETSAPAGYVRYPDYALVRKEDGSITVSVKPDGSTEERSSETWLEHKGAEGSNYEIEDKFWIDGRGGTVMYDHRGDNQAYQHNIKLISVPATPTVSKSDRQTGEHLDDCRFMVTGDFVDGETSIVGLDNEVTKLMSGNVYVSDVNVTKLDDVTCAESVEGGKWYPYTVQEVSEPAGYQIEPVALDFVVDELGTVYLTRASVQNALDNGTPASAIQGRAGESEGSGTGVVFSFSDPQTMVSIQKTTEDGEPLSGATFRLEGERVVLNDKGLTTGQTTTESLELTVDANGRINLTGALISSGSVLDANGNRVERTYQYTLTEVTAPEGYDVLAEPIVFALSQTNELTLIQGADVATVATEDAVAVLKVANKATEPEPTPNPTPTPEPTPKPADGGKSQDTSGESEGESIEATDVRHVALQEKTPQTSDPTLVGLPVSLAVTGIGMILVGSRKRRDADGEEQEL